VEERSNGGGSKNADDDQSSLVNAKATSITHPLFLSSATKLTRAAEVLSDVEGEFSKRVVLKISRESSL
jgi:hypothetical protein